MLTAFLYNVCWCETSLMGQVLSTQHWQISQSPNLEWRDISPQKWIALHLQNKRHIGLHCETLSNLCRAPSNINYSKEWSSVTVEKDRKSIFIHIFEIQYLFSLNRPIHIVRYKHSMFLGNVLLPRAKYICLYHLRKIYFSWPIKSTHVQFCFQYPDGDPKTTPKLR